MENGLRNGALTGKRYIQEDIYGTVHDSSVGSDVIQRICSLFVVFGMIKNVLTLYQFVRL